MEHSANLQLSYIMPSQAEKHVAHNEAIRALDALVQFAVLDRIFPRLPGRQKTEPAISFRLAEAMRGPARTAW